MKTLLLAAAAVVVAWSLSGCQAYMDAFNAADRHAHAATLFVTTWV